MASKIPFIITLAGNMNKGGKPKKSGGGGNKGGAKGKGGGHGHKSGGGFSKPGYNPK